MAQLAGFDQLIEKTENLWSVIDLGRRAV